MNDIHAVSAGLGGHWSAEAATLILMTGMASIPNQFLLEQAVGYFNTLMLFFSHGLPTFCHRTLESLSFLE